MNREKKNRATGMYTAIGVHVLLLLAFFMILAWTAPDPPIPEYGIEMSLGEVLSEDMPSSPPETIEEEVVEEEEPVEEVVEEEIQEEEIVEEEVVEEPIVEEVVKPVTEDINSPDIIEEKPAEVKKEEKKDPVKPASEEKIEEVSEPVKAEPTLNQDALYKKNAGDNKPIASKGASLEMSGWKWDEKPDPNDKSKENGKIVFQITIDDEGEIINVKTIEKTVSPLVEQVYRDAVMELTFSPTVGSRSNASQSTGKISFIIKSN